MKNWLIDVLIFLIVITFSVTAMINMADATTPPAAPSVPPPAATAPDEQEFVVIPAAIWNRIEQVIKHWHERALAAEKRADKCGAA